MREFIIYFKIAFGQRIAKKNIKMNIPRREVSDIAKEEIPSPGPPTDSLIWQTSMEKSDFVGASGSK